VKEATVLKDFFSMQEKMNRVLHNRQEDEAGSNIEADPGGWLPQTDILAYPDKLVFQVELPGLTIDDFSVTLENEALTLRGERKVSCEDGQGERLAGERSYGPFERTFPLPAQVCSEEISARFKDGLLEVTVPRKPAGEAKQIKVRDDS